MPKVNQVGVPEPCVAGEGVKGDCVGKVLLSPADETRVHRDLKEGFAAGDDETTARYPVIGALVKFRPLFTAIQSLCAGLCEPVNKGVRLCPRSAQFNRTDGFREPVGVAVTIRENDNVGGRSLYGGSEGVGLDPGLASVSDCDGPNMSLADPFERLSSVRAVPREGDNYLGHGSCMSARCCSPWMTNSSCGFSR
mgnify:FL=1